MQTTWSTPFLASSSYFSLYLWYRTEHERRKKNRLDMLAKQISAIVFILGSLSSGYRAPMLIWIVKNNKKNTLTQASDCCCRWGWMRREHQRWRLSCPWTSRCSRSGGCHRPWTTRGHRGSTWEWPRGECRRPGSVVLRRQRRRRVNQHQYLEKVHEGS